MHRTYAAPAHHSYTLPTLTALTNPHESALHLRPRARRCSSWPGIQIMLDSPDGTRIVSGSANQTVQPWYVDVHFLLDLADSLIQHDPPIFVGAERALYGFNEWPAREY